MQNEQQICLLFLTSKKRTNEYSLCSNEKKKIWKKSFFLFVLYLRMCTTIYLNILYAWSFQNKRPKSFERIDRIDCNCIVCPIDLLNLFIS